MFVRATWGVLHIQKMGVYVWNILSQTVRRGSGILQNDGGRSAWSQRDELQLET